MTLKIKAERLKREWSQTQLAARAALSTSNVSKFESGRMTPYPAQARRLEQALDLQPGQLLEPADEPHQAIETLTRRPRPSTEPGSFNQTLMTQSDRSISARKLAEAYIEYEDLDELTTHLEAVLHLWEMKGFELAKGSRGTK